MKQLKLKKFISCLLVLAMCLPMLPQFAIWASAYDVEYNPNSYNNATITVMYNDGVPVTNAQLEITVKNGNNLLTHEVKNLYAENPTEDTAGQYVFTRYMTYRAHTLTVTVDSVSETFTMAAYTTAFTATLSIPSPSEPEEPEVPTEPETPTDPETPAAEYETFDVYYIANGKIPDTYHGAGEAINYGPSGNDVALVQIKVDVNKLKTYTDAVVYRERVNWELDNFWEFFPIVGNSGKGEGESTGAVTVEVLNFWNAVKECMHPDSVAAFKETGLYYEYVGYILKRQGWDTAVKDLHCDGILYVQPPVYVVELYDNGTYFGGSLTDSDEGSKFLTAQDILDQYAAYLNQTITWDTDANAQQSGRYTGTYVDSATNKLCTIEVQQTNYGYSQEIEGSQIRYEKRTDTYYLAQFNAVITKGDTAQCTVTYTDGVEDETVFATESYIQDIGSAVTPYSKGIPSRAGYTFAGWHLDGDQSSLYSNERIAAMTVTGDMTFHAVWTPIPKYTGKVQVILNGTWDATTGTLLSGTPVDLRQMLGTSAAVPVALSADNGATLIPMDHTGLGTYTASLENGSYKIYVSTDGGKTYHLASDQLMVIENQDRERYLFYNSVTYIPNGGTFEGSTDSYVEYFANGTQANVRTAIPERDGYAFTGWLNSDGAICQPGSVLHEHTNHACVLTAQWAKAADVYVNVKLHHSNHDTNYHNYAADRNNVTFTVDGRAAGSDVDYTELYVKTIAWDGISEFNVDGYSVTTEVGTHEDHDMDLTTYTATKPTFSNVVLQDMEYTLTSAKSGYETFNITQEEKDGDLYVTLELIYMPDDFDFTFHVKLDEEAKTVSDDIKPVAVNVKVTTWYSSSRKWGVADIHQNTYHRVALDANGEGSGSVPVAQKSGDSNGYYRIQVVSFELPDGTILPALTTNDNVDYATDCGHYSATIDVQSGGRPSNSTLSGAYYQSWTSAQRGTVTAIVSIHTHKLTLLTNNGKFSDNTTSKVISKILTVPDFTGYIPTRDNGYTFAGWYLADENGNMTDTQILPGTEMDKDLTLIAKWIPPVKVNGLISVAATYEQENPNGSITIHAIPENDRAKSILVLLQKMSPSGYYETIDQQSVTLDYSKSEYFFQKDENNLLPVGVAEYEFSQLPGEQQYRIYILSSNYTSTYQQEPDSADSTKRLAYNTYKIHKNLAEFGTVEPDTATVNAHLHFSPPSFDLQFRVDATAIGEGHRPDSAEVLVTCGNDSTITEPHHWGVISQMIFGDKPIGCDVVLENGIANGTDSVWRTSYDGTTLYNYGIRLASTTTGTTKTPYAENPYYTVSYQAPARYLPESGVQTQLLIAYLTPKSYNIIYDTNGGRLTGNYPTTHTWSHETSLADVAPTRAGYEFLGWYTDAALTQKLEATSIDANVAEDVTFYAKWARVVLQVNVEIDHITADGKVSNYYGDLTVQLQSRDTGTTGDYLDVTGQTRTYPSSDWHKNYYQDSISTPNAFTGLSLSSDYSASAYAEGYYVVSTTNELNETTAEDGIYRFYETTIRLKAHCDPKVIFHANNTNATCDDVFRVYYHADTGTPAGGHTLNSSGKVAPFYDIPEFSYEDHNDYIFAGWYTAAVGGQPISWDTVYSRTAGTQHVYARWINVGEVSQHETDTKQLTTGRTYKEYDLAGVQIRKESADGEDHLDINGNVIPGSQQHVYSGLRFVAVLSDRVYEALGALRSGTVEYGFVISRTDTAEYYAKDRGLDQLQYRGSNVNGVDTSAAYNFAQNMRCSGVSDHFSCDDYRLYTGVITFKNQTGMDNPLLARAYLRYTDANGLLRTHYNNYTGNAKFMGGCSASYTQVYNMLNPDSK